MKTKRIAGFITIIAVVAVGFACIFAAACGNKDKHEHSYTSAVTREATCTEEGERTYTCADCGDVYTETIEKIPHNYVADSDDATCTAAGTTYKKCSMCGDIQNGTEVAALGHELTATYNSTSGAWTYACSRGCSSIDVANDPIASLTFKAESGAAFVAANSWDVNSNVEAIIDVTAVIAIPSSETTCKLDKDVIVEKNAAIGITSTLSLDLNGRTISKEESSDDSYGTVQVGSSQNQYGALTVTDSSTGSKGVVSGMYAITIFGATDDSQESTLTISSGNIESRNGIAISTNYNYSNIKISVSGGNISSENGTAIYLPGGELTVSGGKISGNTGIEIRSGSLSVTGGTISTTETGTPTAPNTSSSSGTTASGYAIAETNNNNYGSSVTVTISGGTVEGTMYSTGTNISVSGGTFTIDPQSFVASGYAATQSGSVWVVSASTT